jgi:hypothetical protein
MRIASALSLAFALVTAGCNRDCGPEYRQTSVMADIHDPEEHSVGIVYVFLTEERGERDTRTLSVSFNGPGTSPARPFADTIDGARLVRTTGEVLYEVEVSDSPEYAGVIVITRTEFDVKASRYESIRQGLIAGEVVVELTTDLPGMEVIRTPLPRAEPSGFMRTQCPGFLD